MMSECAAGDDQSESAANRKQQNEKVIKSRIPQQCAIVKWKNHYFIIECVRASGTMNTVNCFGFAINRRNSGALTNTSHHIILDFLIPFLAEQELQMSSALWFQCHSSPPRELHFSAGVGNDFYILRASSFERSQENVSINRI